LRNGARRNSMASIELTTPIKVTFLLSLPDRGFSRKRSLHFLFADNTPAIQVLSSIGEVCGPMRLILSSLRFGTIVTIYSIESFRELLSTRSMRAMTALR
jgi:hypothetical protein